MPSTFRASGPSPFGAGAGARLDLTAREVVTRNGFVLLNRTDLDVTLSLDAADVRIRRLGLDIDPGWLPWFGKVVRFHYAWDEKAHVH